ncbi:hypothetical protein COOONC_00509 [Cooperia oncophora]
MALRQLVDHPLLIQDVLTKLAAPEEIMKLVPTASSGKIAALGQLLSECGIGVTFEEEDPEDEDPLSSIPVELPHRALIFCQWKSSVQLVSNALSRGDFGAPIAHLVLDGSVPPSERQAIVDRFNTDHLIDVLVLTTHVSYNEIGRETGLQICVSLILISPRISHRWCWFVLAAFTLL